MKTWIIVVIVVVVLLVVVLLFMSFGKKKEEAPVVIAQAPQSNWSDFATSALPSILSLFNNRGEKPVPKTGIGSVPPTQPLTTDNPFAFADKFLNEE